MSARQPHRPGLRITVALVGLAHAVILCGFYAWIR